jgi:hypothetical protein
VLPVARDGFLVVVVVVALFYLGQRSSFSAHMLALVKRAAQLWTD